jgi:hypothetical protein
MKAQIQQQLPPEYTEYYRLTDPRNFPEYCSKYLKIHTKEKGVQPFMLNTAQLRLHKKIMELKDERIRLNRPEGVKIIILKARQMGYSTVTKGYEYFNVTTREGFRTATIAHNEKSTQHLYGMFKLFYDKFPQDLVPHRNRPGNRTQMVFNELESSLNVFTAGSKMATSSFTFQFVHISELSKWEGDVSAAWTSLLQTLPTGADMIIESTANGVGNLYHDLWLDAVAGKNDYHPMFFPWFEQYEYRIPAREGEIFIPDEDERYYMDKFDLDLDQVRWMRYTRLNKCNGDWSIFRQEYPAEPEEAFIESGNPVFNIKKLRVKENAVKSIKPKIGEISLIRKLDENDKIDYDVEFVEQDGGSVRMYHPPQDVNVDEKVWKNRYLIGADSCEGIDSGSGNKYRDTDSNAVSVLDQCFPKEGGGYEQRQVMAISNKFEPYRFAEQLFAVLAFYGQGMNKSDWGMVIPERNGPGTAVIEKLKELFFLYDVSLMHMLHEEGIALDFSTPLEKLGLRTTGARDGSGTKNILISETVSRINNGTDGIVDVDTIHEHMYYVRDERGRTNAQRGKHDDLVIANGLTYFGVNASCFVSPTVYKKNVGKKGGWRDKLRKNNRTKNKFSYF